MIFIDDSFYANEGVSSFLKKNPSHIFPSFFTHTVTAWCLWAAPAAAAPPPEWHRPLGSSWSLPTADRPATALPFVHSMASASLTWVEGEQGGVRHRKAEKTRRESRWTELRSDGNTQGQINKTHGTSKLSKFVVYSTFSVQHSPKMFFSRGHYSSCTP